jgi:transcriptional regulator with XRE-family HTH domain
MEIHPSQCYTARVLHDLVRTARERRDLTVVAAARLANVSRIQYARFERGQSVTLNTVWKILSVFPELGHLTLTSAIPGAEHFADVRKAAEETHAATARLLTLLGRPTPSAPLHESGLPAATAQRLESLVDQIQAELGRGKGRAGDN